MESSTSGLLLFTETSNRLRLNGRIDSRTSGP